MKFKEYSSYKDSGVEWIGKVPEHWSVKRFCYVFKENKRKNIGLKETNVLSLSYGKIKEKNIDDNKGLLPESFETYQIIEPNDIIFRFTDLQNDKRSLRSAISKYHGIITSAYISVKTSENSYFYNYLFRTYDIQKVFYSMGDGLRQSLKIDELNKMPIVLPDSQEQDAIVVFLNNETTRIDNLISKQEKLIQLLEEQCKSVICNAVTKGLDTHRPMKSSEIEQIGDIPTNWQVIKLRWLTKSIKTGGTPEIYTPTLEFKDDYINWFTPGDFDESLLLQSSTKKVDPSAIEKNDIKIIPKNSVLLIGIGGTLGKVGYTISDASANQQINYVVPDTNKISTMFLTYYLSTKDEYMKSMANFSTLAILNQQKTGDLYIAVPPIKEQLEITTFIERKRYKYIAIVKKQKKLIKKLKEYRASIISHAVTGKIDVREFGA